MSFSNELEKAFNENSNTENAVSMSKYMKNNFQFFGIKTEERRKIFKSIWTESKKEVSENTREIALFLYSKKERELHYCAIEILIKNLKNNYIKEDIQLIEKLITTNSWWDSTDFLSKYVLGNYLLQFPEETDSVILNFSSSENMWLNRSAILFQLGYKEKTNFEVLKLVCKKHKMSTEFFIQKAIGWALREYAKTNPEAVKNFVSISSLKKLSENEALKNLK
jgi:3-methyladenine DNA glycosylase AlkD